MTARQTVPVMRPISISSATPTVYSSSLRDMPLSQIAANDIMERSTLQPLIPLSPRSSRTQVKSATVSQQLVYDIPLLPRLPASPTSQPSESKPLVPVGGLKFQAMEKSHLFSSNIRDQDNSSSAIAPVYFSRQDSKSSVAERSSFAESVKKKNCFSQLHESKSSTTTYFMKQEVGPLKDPPTSVNEVNGVSAYDALSHPRDPLAGHEPRWENLYRGVCAPVSGKTTVTTPFYGDVDGTTTNQMDIAYTRYGDLGMPVIILHGVPTNRHQWHPVAERLGHFCRVLTFDMLGMGESSMPLNYGKTLINQEFINKPLSSESPQPWDWVYDCSYISQMIDVHFPGEKVFFIADDWGGGIVSHSGYQLQEKLAAIGYLNPISFDGYPVSEIQAFGRASQLWDTTDPNSTPDAFVAALGSADQTMVQIFKTMVYDQNTYNQYNLRDIKTTYADTDYDRSTSSKGEDSNATSLTLRLKPIPMKVLCDRSAILSPALLLPYHPIKNPKGVPYEQINLPVLVMWGENDNMMPAQQVWRFLNVFPNANVSVDFVPRAGHFAAQDQPDIVAEDIMKFIVRQFGKSAIADVFYGFGDRGSGGRHVIWKGDEQKMISDLRTLNGLQQ